MFAGINCILRFVVGYYFAVKLPRGATVVHAKLTVFRLLLLLLLLRVLLLLNVSFFSRGVHWDNTVNSTDGDKIYDHADC